jgi:fibronectin-binding autotransporter adhesin
LGTDFMKPVDAGDAKLFRTLAPSNLNVATGSVVQAGGMTNVGTVSLAGTAQVKLNGTGLAVASSASVIEVTGSASGSIEVTRAGDSMTVANLNLTGGLALSGAGNFKVIGAGSGTGALTKDGSGTLTVDGSIAGTTTVNGGTLQGNGTFVGGLTLTAATIAPGSSPGLMTTSSLTANNSTAFRLEIGSGITSGTAVAGTQYDQIVVTGDTVDLGGASLSLIVNSHLQVNDVFTIILNDGADIDPGTFSGFANGALINLADGYQVRISYFDDASLPGLQLTGGNDVSLLVTIPEPTTAVSLFAGLGILTGLQRFRRRRG